jgi:hypothetical protein
MATVSFPTAGTEGCSSGETVCWLKLEKVDGVDRWLTAHIDLAVAYVRSRGQGIERRTHDGMHEVRVDAFPWIRPVVGVRDGAVVIATSPAAIAAIDRVRAGTDPDIRSNSRFSSLGIGTGTDTGYISYAQLDSSGGAAADILAAFGFIMSVVPMPPDPRQQRDMRVPMKLGVILTKLAPALRELDVGLDVASEYLSGQRAGSILSRTAYRYR